MEVKEKSEVMETGFKKRQIVGSFQRFRDHISYVFNSDILTFLTHFQNLINFCETDEVIKIITSQLKQIDISYDDWLKQLPSYPNGTLEFHLPPDEDKRTALLYKICLKVHNKEINILNFSLSFDYSLNPDGTVRFFNTNILTPFINSIGYKIDDISDMINEEYRETTTIPVAVLNVYYDNKVTGSPITIGDIGKIGDGAIIGHGSRVDIKKEIHIGDGSKKYKVAPPDVSSIEFISKLLINKLGYRGTAILDIITFLLSVLGIPIGFRSILNMPSNEFTKSTFVEYVPKFPEHAMIILLLGFVSLICFIIISDALHYYKISKCQNCGRDFALIENRPRERHDVDAIDAVYRQEDRYTECRYCHDKRTIPQFFEFLKKKEEE